jgi:hypothetical protein
MGTLWAIKKKVDTTLDTPPDPDPDPYSDTTFHESNGQMLYLRRSYIILVLILTLKQTIKMRLALPVEMTWQLPEGFQSRPYNPPKDDLRPGVLHNPLPTPHILSPHCRSRSWLQEDKLTQALR